MEEVYNWVGSLSPNPDLFNLCTGVPDSYFPIDPNDGVLKFENRILTVMEKYNSDFTMDIVTGSNILTSTATALATSTVPKTPSPVKLPNKENPKGRCPVCSEFFDMVDLESHGSRCADNKFYVTVSSEEEVEEVLERNEIETLLPEKKNVPDILKELDVDRRNGLNLSVRRGRSFNDYADKMKLPWVKKKKDFVLVVRFLGEPGIDLGVCRVSREFFSGKSYYD